MFFGLECTPLMFDEFFVCCRMIGRLLTSRVVLTSLVRRVHCGISGSDLVMSRRNGINFCFRFRSVLWQWMASQQMSYCSNVVNSPHPELTILREDPPSVPHFVIDTLKNYSKQTALVGCHPLLDAVIAEVGDSSLIQRVINLKVWLGLKSLTLWTN